MKPLISQAELAGMAGAVKIFLDERLQPILDELAAIRRRLDELETRSKDGTPVALYRGVHRADESYQRGDLVTRGGSLWLAVDSPGEAVPGRSPEWKMIVKSGGLNE